MTDKVIVKRTPFRAAFFDRMDDEQRELEELDRKRFNPTEEDKIEAEVEAEQNTLPAPANAEEETFKKRYGDLRRHLAVKEQEWNARLTQLESQLETATKKEIVLPKTDEEIEQFAREYPDIYNIIETVAIKKAQNMMPEVEKLREQVENDKRAVARQNAEAELYRLHPDFDEIRTDPAFHEWAAAQPANIQAALYHNETVS